MGFGFLTIRDYAPHPCSHLFIEKEIVLKNIILSRFFYFFLLPSWPFPGTMQ